MSNADINDNSISLRRLYIGKDKHGDFSRRIAYRPIFCRLVEKYVTKSFKSFPQSREFQNIEQLIVLLLDSTIRHYENDDPRTASWPLEGIARELEIPVIHLYNDEEFIASLKAARNAQTK